MDSILNSVKKTLGINEDYEHFDPDIIMHINSTFMILNQIGIGPPNGFSIIDKSSVWSEFIGEDPRLESVKSYMFLKVKSMFDPSSSSSVNESYNNLIKELEWRLNVMSDTLKKEGEIQNG